MLKAILKTGSGSLATVLFGMATVKLIAWRLGPEALGSFSLTRQLIVAGSALFLTGGQTALVQGISSRQGRDRETFAATSFVLLCGGSLVVAAVVAIAGRWLGGGLFPTSRTELVRAIPIAAIAISISGPLAFVFGALNAARRIGRLAIAQALNAATLAALVWGLLPLMRPDRPLWFASVLAVSQVPGLVLGAIFLRQERFIELRVKVCPAAMSHFGRVALATVAAAGAQAWTVLALRSLIANRFGFGMAGLFDAGWSISMVYVMLILSSFSTYYLPTLAGAGEHAIRLMNQVLRTTLMIVVPLIALVMALRPLLLVVLYSQEFLGVSPMMRWMLMGDFLKVISFVLAMPMLARADIRAFLIGEAGWNLSMFGGTRIALGYACGVEASGGVFALSYGLYFLYVVAYCRRQLGWRWPRELMAATIAAVAILVVVSGMTWSVTEVNWVAVVAALAGGGVQVFLGLRGRTRIDDPQPVVLEAGA